MYKIYCTVIYHAYEIILIDYKHTSKFFIIFLYRSEHDYGSVFNIDDSDKSDMVKPKNKSFFSPDAWGLLTYLQKWCSTERSVNFCRTKCHYIL
jgi:hypothetical protein